MRISLEIRVKLYFPFHSIYDNDTENNNNDNNNITDIMIIVTIDITTALCL